MPARTLRRAATGLLALMCAGCTVETFTYTVDHYGNVTSRVVTLGCRDAYEVYDRPDAGLLLVTTGPVNEAIAGACGSAPRPRPERLRQVARIFLDETTDRPECRVDRERAITDNHTEFHYRCPAPRVAPARRG